MLSHLEENDMAKNAQKRTTSVEELASFFGPVLARPGTEDGNLTIPGIDAYVPSYMTGGSDQRQAHEQLEPNSKRNK